VTVPRVLDHKLDDAINILRSRDLLSGDIDKRPDKHPANTVLFQNPAPGTVVKPESRIDLVIAIPKRVPVPGLRGRTIPQARDVLKEFDLVLGNIGQQATESEPPGHIVRQRPEEGSMATVGAEVDVAVAVQSPVAVPRLIEEQKGQAEEILAEHRLRLGKVRSHISDEEPGTIIDQAPEPGSRVKAGSSVNIVVASPEMVEVPPLVGHWRDEAAGCIQASRLRLGHIAERPSSKPDNTVIRQEPAADTLIPVGSRINLVVSHPQLVRIPDLIGHSIDDAPGLVEQAQLALGEIEQKASEQAEGRILSQEPGPGAEVPVNTRVHVTVATLAPIIVPSLIGLTEEYAMHVLKEHKLILGQRREQQSSEEQSTVIAQTPEPGIQVTQYARIDLIIATARNYLLLVIAASALVLLVSTSAYATVRFRGKRKPAAKLRVEIRLKPTVDPGKSHVDPANGLDKGMDIRLRPVSDVGRQAVRTDTKIIEEDSEHD
jgi:beta-lactam-binding protein with PASTA domain